MATSSSLATLSAFPFLTSEEFRSACCALITRLDAITDPAHPSYSSVKLIQQATGGGLKFARTLEATSAEHITHSISEKDGSEEPQLCEDDPEALVRTSNLNPSLQVEYDILLSPVYRVPVLYFILRSDEAPQPLGIDSVYQYLVPDQFRKQVQSVGVMGGISLGYHPESGGPAFFVHPCNTADAMRQIAGWRKITPEIYLLIWLGLVGNCLGLHLPYEIFANVGIQDLSGH